MGTFEGGDQEIFLVHSKGIHPCIELAFDRGTRGCGNFRQQSVVLLDNRFGRLLRQPTSRPVNMAFGWRLIINFARVDLAKLLLWILLSGPQLRGARPEPGRFVKLAAVGFRGAAF